MEVSCALVLFVKTPGLSPVKTRLARDIGKARAEEFYALSLRATAARAHELIKATPTLAVYWAVAEASGLKDSQWLSFPTISQGDGDLGMRLSRVYDEVLKLHPVVCFMGADSPHISTSLITENIEASMRDGLSGFQIGKTLDGGFYFFGGGLAVPREVWTEVEYSSEKTANQLINRLESLNKTSLRPMDFDVDTITDLFRLAEIRGDGLLLEQKEVIAWARSTTIAFRGR